MLLSVSVPNRFSGIRDFPYLKLRIRDSGFGIREIQARLGIKNIKGGRMRKITIGITGLYKILNGDYGIEEPLYCGTAEGLMILWPIMLCLFLLLTLLNTRLITAAFSLMPTTSALISP